MKRSLPFYHIPKAIFGLLLLLVLLLSACGSNNSETAAPDATLPWGIFPEGTPAQTTSEKTTTATVTQATSSISSGTTEVPTEAAIQTMPPTSGSYRWQQDPLSVEDLEGELEGVDYSSFLPVPEGVSRAEGSLDYLYSHNGINHVGGGEKVIALSFSIGTESGWTSSLLDVLKEKDVSATFLISLKEYLNSANGNPEELIRRMVQEGHAIGSHGFTHVHSTMATNRRFVNELLLFQVQIDKTLRYHYPLTFFGAPYETLIERDIYLCDLMGIHFLGYSCLLKDENGQSPVYMVLPQMKDALIPGSIIQMHVSEGNVEALKDFIDYAREQGYRFVLPSK